MTGGLYNAKGERVAKGTITTMSCDPNTDGFQLTKQDRAELMILTILEVSSIFYQDRKWKNIEHQASQ